ncbi:MAG: ion channel [Rhodothermales bacterium]
MLSPRNLLKQRRTGKGNQEIPVEDLNDLGFGSRVVEESRLRLLNRDGSFNVARKGLSFFRSMHLYHALLTMSWSRFFLTSLAAYCVVNVLFAVGFVLCGPEALSGVTGTTLSARFLDAFFFSVQTFTTVGFGHISPNSLAADLLVTFDAFVGLLAFALAAGLVFARFSRPSTRITFSERAVIAPYRDVTAFEFRIVNERRSQLIEVEAKVAVRLTQHEEGQRTTRFHSLPLERSKVAFFPLHWTVVHPIDEDSPLFGYTPERLQACRAEFLILLTAIDDTFLQVVHARSSYRYDEVVFGARFADLLEPSDEGMVRIDLRRLHDIEQVAL